MFRWFSAASWLAVVAILVPGAQAASVTMVVPHCQAATGNEIKVPIQARRAEGLGAFQMELVYDPVLLEFQEVEEGTMLPGAMLAANLAEAGRVKIAGVGDPQKPIRGDGELVLIRFRVLGEGGQECPLRIENALAWEQTDAAFDMLVTTEPGKFTAERSGRPWIFVAVGGGLLVMLVVRFATRRMAASKA